MLPGSGVDPACQTLDGQRGIEIWPAMGLLDHVRRKAGLSGIMAGNIGLKGGNGLY